MIAYKFLSSGRRGPFSGFRWPADGTWVEVDTPLKPCRAGVHACRPAQLPYWIDDELWRIELDGDIRDETLMTVARRGRLLEPVEGWSPETMLALSAACAERARAYPEWREDIQPHLSKPEDVAIVCYAVARGAGKASSDWRAGYDAERSWQARWLTERLGLEA